MVSNDAPHVLLASGRLVVHHEDSVRNEKRDKRVHMPPRTATSQQALTVSSGLSFSLYIQVCYLMLKKLLLYFM